MVEGKTMCKHKSCTPRTTSMYQVRTPIFCAWETLMICWISIQYDLPQEGSWSLQLTLKKHTHKIFPSAFNKKNKRWVLSLRSTLKNSAKTPMRFEKFIRARVLWRFRTSSTHIGLSFSREKSFWQSSAWSSKTGINIKPTSSMYGIFTYIWLIFMVNVGKYTIHGSYGKWQDAAYKWICYHAQQIKTHVRHNKSLRLFWTNSSFWINKINSSRKGDGIDLEECLKPLGVLFFMCYH